MQDRVQKSKPKSAQTAIATHTAITPEEMLVSQHSAQPHHDILNLQATIGNQAVQRLLYQRGDTVQREGIEEASSEAESEQQALETKVDEMKGDETLYGISMPLTPDWLEMLDPGTQGGTESEPGKRKSHKDKYTYGEVKGEAFFDKNVVDPNSVRQGDLGDCYFLASMIAIARANPGAISRLIKGPNKDGSYDVTLYVDKGMWWWKSKEAKVVNVTPNFPVDKSGAPAYAKSSNVDATKGMELWPLLLEKAYAKLQGGYEDIIGGYGTTGMEALTGGESTSFEPDDFGDDELVKKISDMQDNGYALTASSIIVDEDDKEGNKKITTEGVVANHEYAIKWVDKGAKTISLQNPWGYKHLEDMPISKFKKFYRKVSALKVGK